MNRIAIPAVLLVVPCLFCAKSRPAERSVALDRRASLLEQLRSDDWQAADQLLGDLVPERDGTILALLELASGREEHPRKEWLKYRAIELLGKYRAGGACRLLIQEVEYAPEDFIVDEEYALKVFPAADALVQIGERAMHEILISRMKGQVTDKQLKLFAYVIWDYYAPQEEQELGLVRIRLHLERARGARERLSQKYGLKQVPAAHERNLTRLIDMYQKINPRDSKDWPQP